MRYAGLLREESTHLNEKADALGRHFAELLQRQAEKSVAKSAGRITALIAGTRIPAASSASVCGVRCRSCSSMQSINAAIV
jgi:hypothetical protein